MCVLNVLFIICLCFVGCEKAFIRKEEDGFAFLSRLMYFCGLKKHSITENGFQKYYQAGRYEGEI